ncbi:uncharacterized protein LOC131690937 [Topomyia yanbarensis]|uniref:uncharacterized protein LOC131690937 n=1 Tax=Topomyia yanbarensis TaxID=2498891 RepID=UPI00273B54E3|nr:uncharacterized protein LOC131690937 [Topomyia yanbarensis]
MNIDSLPKEFPASCIDLKRKDVTHISAWINREEFQLVFDRIFSSDVASKECALQTLKVWKIRQNRHTPVSVLCTLTILEVQIYDAKRQQDSKEAGNGVEIKNLYSGAFTRFINYLTESHQQSGAGRRGTIANRVKEIGIEGFLVELRHLCAHSAMSISVDVFRRSADYCMNWLKVCYWQRELQLIESCDAKQIKRDALGSKHEEDLKYMAAVYDVATKAIHMGAQTLSAAEKQLTSSQFKLLQKHSLANNADQLNTIVFDVVRYLSENMKLPKSSETVPAVCNAFLSCRYMFEAPVKGNTQGLACIHQRLFQVLVARGYIQTYLEKLIDICENGQESTERRLGAKFWAIEIALAFRLLKKFKKLVKSLPDRSHRFIRRDHTKKMSNTVRAIYENRLRVDLQNTIIIGMSTNCPWHLRFSRNYLIDRILNVNEYTKEILPIILALAEPHLTLSQRETIEAAMEKYTLNYLAVVDEEDMQLDESIGGSKTSTPKRVGARKQTQSKVYSLEDVFSATGRKPVDAVDQSSGGTQKPKQFGVWSAVPADGLDWGSCPLGKLVWD